MRGDRTAWSAVVGLALGATGCGRLGFDAGADAGPPPYLGPWQELGGSATGGGITDLPPDQKLATLRVAVGADNNPVVSWADSSSGNSEAYLRAWDGTSWIELGGSASPSGLSNDPDDTRAGGLAVGPSGRTCTSWFDDTTLLIRLVCWIDGAWVGLAGSEAGSITPANIPWWPQLAFDGDDLVVAWEEYVGPIDASVYLKRYTDAWGELGGSATGDGVWPTAGAIQIGVVAHGGVLWLFWEAADGSEIYAAEWTGAAWSDKAGSMTTSISASPGVPSARPVMALGHKPTIAWTEDPGVDGAGAIHLRQFEGDGWYPLGSPAIPTLPAPAFYPSIGAGPTGEPIVIAVLGGDVHITRYDRQTLAWTAPGNQGSNVSMTGYANWPELAIAPDGTIYVAWMNEAPGGEQIYLRYLSP